MRDGDDALHHCRVRQLRHTRHDIADGVQILFFRFHVHADMHETTLELGFRFLEPAIFCQRFASHGQQQLFSLQILFLAVLIRK